MAKSYAQVKGQQVVDWKKELQLVIEGKESKVDFKLAGDWKTCHVGQQSEMIERDDDNAPEDGILVSLGRDFTGNVQDGEYSEALNICHMIDIRVAYLLKERKDQILEDIAEKEAELKELKAELKKF